MKLLVFGHWSHTGFGVVTEAIGSRLVQAGVDVRILGTNHRGEPIRGPLAGRVWPLEGLQNYIKAVTASAINGELWRRLDPDDEWQPDAILAIADVTGLLGYVGQNVKEWQSLPVYHYCPIEGDNLPPLWRQLWSLEGGLNARPVAMSDYGARVIGEHIGRPVPRIYHGVDTEVFHPVSPNAPIRIGGDTLYTRDDCRRWMGLDTDRRYLLRADRNATRKFYDVLISSFAMIAERDPLVDLILHCQPIEQDGVDIWQEILRMPEHLRERVKFTNAHDTFKGLPPAGLNALYNAADIYISTTGGEGFGLTLAESMAAGTPVVCTDWAAEREVIGDGGLLIPPLHDAYGQPVRFHSKFGMDWAVPDARAFVEPVLTLLDKPARRRAIGASGRLHVKRNFSWDVAASEFIDLFGATDAVGIAV